VKSQFLLALCQPGFENALKAEAMAQGAKPSFQRKGVVTFKAPREIDVDEATFESVFARYIGLQTNAPLDAKRTDLVETIVDVDGKPWRAVHAQANARTPWPQGIPPLVLPDEAPSRAWLKLEEAAALFDIPFRAGQRALEVGSAPGGATHALLQRGLDVVGIDPNEMDPRILAHARFRHLKMTSMNVDAAALAALGAFQWLLLDVNVPPRTALHGALPLLRPSLEGRDGGLEGFVFTLKMKDASLAGEIDDWLSRIRAAVGQSFALHVRQLWSNGSEICVTGLRARSQVPSSRG
jgi:23S rRNA (cytidine2498-2'-O)-methyltransferase